MRILPWKPHFSIKYKNRSFSLIANVCTIVTTSIVTPSLAQVWKYG